MQALNAQNFVTLSDAAAPASVLVPVVHSLPPVTIKSVGKTSYWITGSYPAELSKYVVLFP